MKTIQKLFLIFLMFCSLPSLGQQATEVKVSGKVLDNTTQQPLEYAGVTLLSLTGNKILKTTVTDKKGEFTLVTNPGQYHLKIEFISYKPTLLENKQIKEDTNLGNIGLQENVKLLKSVNVIGEKSTVELNLDKKVFNVGKDLISKGGSANDILNNVPSVNVDANGGVSLRGNGSVRVLINGKPSMLTANNGLEQIPASNIEKVEVITNPSARYEAQGGGGIINIILKKNTIGGLNGSVQAGLGDPVNYHGNLNLSYKTEKFNLFSNVGGRSRDFYASEKRFQTTTKNGLTNILNQQNKQRRNDDTYNIYVGGDYYINPKNTLTGSFYHSTLFNRDTTNFGYSYYNGGNTLDSAVTRFENYREPQRYNQLELNYVKTFDNKDQKWTTNLQYDFWNDDENQDISQAKNFPLPKMISRLTSRNIESSDDIYIQSDFVTAFSKDSRFEAGIRTDLRAIRSDYWAKADEVLLAKYNNKLKYDENLYSAYMQYGNKINKFSYLLGLRAELSHIGISDRAGTFDQDKKYLNLFPTVHLTYKLPESAEFQLSYSRRINRPQFWQLNPFSGLSDIRNLTVGNPDLDPTYTNSFEFSMIKRLGKLNINPSIYYKHTTNYFQFVIEQTPDGYFVSTPVNLDFEDRYGFELSSSYNPFGWWRLSWDFNYYKFKQQGAYDGKNYGAKDQTWFTRIGSKMKFPKNLSIESSLNYIGKKQDIQSINKAQYRADIAVSKDLFKDKMSFTLGVINVFDSMVDKRVTNTDTYYLESESRRFGRLVSATIVYRFNRKKDDKDRLPDE
ncbi:outer membrane beta-barrel family protein [Pedobacter caeni]|uniref:Outer membrane receptor proteins, mostly Fe transport n=1 Tax=Pedobacter caeni TaxID=288992 RepID=A0A1M5EK43_9SPHI|nr:outer membrane beta-barrel family protein [Pedobacter caeni]SHF79536.1 Outer membrane receptor proteins, mostly Fe transport [Pedobacter caeni]